MKTFEIVFVILLLLIVIFLAYGSISKSKPQSSNEKPIKSIIKKQDNKNKNVSFPPDLRKSELSSLSHVQKNQKPTKELSDVYQEARDSIPTDNPFNQLEGKTQNPPMRFNI